MAAPITHIRKKGETTCNEHNGEQLHLYCVECDTIICQNCVPASHSNHNTCELSNTMPETKHDIENFIERIEQNDLVQLRQCIISTDTLLKDNDSGFEDLANKLEMQTEQLKIYLDLLKTQTLSNYHRMKEDNKTLIHRYKQDLVFYESQLKRQIQDCKTAVHHGTQIEIYDAGCEIHSQVSLPVKPALTTVSFTPNKNPELHLKLALGETGNFHKEQASTVQDWTAKTCHGQESTTSSQQPEPETRSYVKQEVTSNKRPPHIKILEEWRSPVIIRSMCPINDGQVWTSDYVNDSISLLNRKGKIIQQVKHIAYINDMSLSPTTYNLWVCDRENNIMELVLGQLAHKFITKETPICICASANDHVILGMAKHIAKFTTEGQIILDTITEGKEKPLLCSPWRISECPVTHNLAVIDKNKSSEGGDEILHVIVLDTDFNKLFVYRGDIHSTQNQLSHNGARPFHPWDVLYDRKGNIIIGDFNNHRILLITGRGEFLKIIHTDSHGIYALCLDKDDVLWAVSDLEIVKLLQFTSV